MGGSIGCTHDPDLARVQGIRGRIRARLSRTWKTISSQVDLQILAAAEYDV